MKLKAVSGMMLTLLLLGILTLAFDIQPVKAGSLPYVFVDPPTVDVAVGAFITVEVKVANVTDCYGVDFRLIYNDTLLQYTGYYHRGPGAVIGSLPDAALTLIDVSVAGTVIVSILFKEYYVPRPDSFNGTGVVAWVEFQGLAEGVSPLSFVEMWTFLYNSAPGVITRDPCVPGEIVVIAPPPPTPVGGKAIPINIPMNKPETPTLWIWLTTIILSLAVTIVYVKKRKRKTEINS